MSTVRKPKSSLALRAALDVIGPCHPATAAYLIFRASARHLADTMGDRKAAELVYDAADNIATGDDI